MTNQIKSDLLKNPTVKNIDRAKMALDSFFGSLPDRYKELQEPQKIQLERIRTISEHLWVRLNMTEPALIVLNDLTQLRGQADQFAAHIDKSIVEFNPGDLNRAENLADDLLKNMTHIPAAPPGKSGPYTRAANEAALKFEELVKRLRKSEQKNEQLQAIQQSLDEELRGKVVEAAANWDEQYVITYRDLKSKNDDATELLQTVGTGALNRQYITERSTQARHDGLWTALGFASLVAILGSGASIYISTGAAGITWDEVPGRFLTNSPLIGALTAIAAVSFRRAGYHRRREERASRIVNELNILKAFTGDLPEWLRYAVLAQITPRYFVGGGSEQQQVTEATGLSELLPQVGELGSDGESSAGS